MSSKRPMRMGQFILDQMEAILLAWEDFARTIEPPAFTMDSKALRNHASHMLKAIALDLETPQSSFAQAEKSKGRGPREKRDTAAETHAAERLKSGYTIEQLVSEYRALRASVLHLWGKLADRQQLADPDGIMRFNEAIDQAVAESVARFAQITSVNATLEQRRMDAVLQAAPVAIFLVDSCGKLLLANAESRRIWGEHPLAEVVDDHPEWKGWWADGSAKHGQALKAEDWAVARALTGEEPSGDIVEIEAFGCPGQRRTIMLRAAPVRDSQSKIVGSVVAQMDITEQVRAERALRDSEAKFRTITDAMPQMVWSTRPNGYHDYYNQRWYDFTGMPVGSTDGDGWKGCFHPDDQARAGDAWQHSLATGELYEIQYRLRHHSGEYRWTLGRAMPVRGESGKIVRWMGSCTDIHEQKIAAETLRQSDRRKDEFLAMLAHELRNPLAPISAAAELLRLVNMDEAGVRQTSEIIERQVKHMTNLVDDLLDVSRVTKGLVKLEKEPLDMRRIVADAVEQVAPLIRARRHQLKLHMPPEKAIVLGDNKRLVQVLANLLANAAKYTHEGGNILVKAELQWTQFVLTVQDDGIGMVPELVDRVFDLFAQAERTSDRSLGGLGLGLALVKSLVEAHGGTVVCTSKGPGQGSEFTVRLPRLLNPVQQPERRRIARPPVLISKPLKIMVVDDNADAAHMLSLFLEASGHQVVVEQHSRRALEMARIEKPDVCLLDIGLPDMDGNELAQRLRAQSQTSDAVLIAVTGYGQEQDRLKAMAAGFDHHMVKPVDTAKLSAVLAAIGSS